MDPVQSPGSSKKHHRQKRLEDDGAALSGGQESPSSHSGEEQFASLSSVGPAKSNYLSPSFPEGDEPLTKDLSPGDDTTARNYRFILMVGQLISGLGATPINTVTIAYLDENLPRRQSSLYIGIFNSMTIVGPAVGFIVGGYTLTYYVDISTDVSSMGLTSKSPAWVGAWWLGSVVTAVMGLILGVKTCSLLKYLPDTIDVKSKGGSMPNDPAHRDAGVAMFTCEMTLTLLTICNLAIGFKTGVVLQKWHT